VSRGVRALQGQSRRADSRPGKDFMDSGSWIGVVTLSSIAFGAAGFLTGKSLAPETIVERRVEVPVPAAAPAPPALHAASESAERKAYDDESRKLVVGIADTMDQVADNLSDGPIAEYDALLTRPPAPVKPEAALEIREMLARFRRLRDDLRFGSRRAMIRLSEPLEGLDADMDRIANQAAQDLDKAGVPEAAKTLRGVAAAFRNRKKADRDAGK